MNQDKKVAVGFVIAALLAGIAYAYWHMSPFGPSGQGCTTEAKICPDGSAVGRTGPNCEFAACPGEGATDSDPDTTGWIATTTTQGISFKYPPEATDRDYVHPTDWPPAVDIHNGTVSCMNEGSDTQAAGETSHALIGGHEYCLNRESEGAAGSIYTTYTYSSQRAGQVVALSFIIRTVQCMNYDEPQRSACQAAQAAFDPGTLADGIISTVVLP